MKYKQYDKAVNKIHNVIENIKDEKVQEVWVVVSDLWADFENHIIDAVCED